jgi:acylphosphatase
MQTRAEIIIKGRVQKAGYRDLIDQRAYEHSLTGTVENLPDKTVKVVCEGDEEDIKAFVEEVKIKEYPVDVQDIKIHFSAATGEFTTFDIVRGELTDEVFSSMDMAAHYLRQMNTELGGTLDSFRIETKEHFDRLDSKYHRVSENLEKIAVNNAKTSENLDRLVNLVETLVREKSNRT